MSYRSDREWADLHLPHIKAIVGPLLLEQAPEEVDRKEATDLVVLLASADRVACRIRKPGALPKFEHDFTIRSKRSNGYETELHKILRGFARFMFYCHSDPKTPGRIIRWMLIDLDVWRTAVKADPRLLGEDKPNVDGETFFRAYDIRHFPGALRHTSHPIKALKAVSCSCMHP